MKFASIMQNVLDHDGKSKKMTGA